MRSRRKRRDDPCARLAQDIRRAAGFMAAVVDEASRLGLPVPELATACINARRRWGWQLDGRK
jgi:hypothetical protein